KVDKLVETVKRELEGGAKRIMVFTNYRSTASKLVKALNERLPSAASAVRLVGQFKKDGDTGLTQREQVAILDDFKGGKHNVLVATQIGEEGLDIVECDEVIFYDSVPSAIRYIQRRGRTGRKTPGKVIVLMASGTKDEGYYWIAKRREKAMGEALAKLSKKFGEDRGQAKMDDFFNFLKEEKDGVKVLVDAREANSRAVSELSRLGASIELRALPCGDFVVSDRVVVERKASEDFCSSIIDGRLFEQAKRLKESYERPVILVEGDPLFTLRNLRPEAVAGAVSSLLTDFGLSLISTKDPRETALLIYSLARREQIIERREPKLRGEKKPLSLSALQEYVVSGLPGVDTVIAKRLLERFKSVEKVFTASERELKEVEGIGEKISRKIREVLTAAYSPEGDV
ncbi:TPA: DEAD/DEAH box helicase, partial [Candidatus Bathyarchaeota archaeon]|nr:DEAD/DEAH box helicase [Candidatus Bathyarchaeota archaeon]